MSEVWKSIPSKPGYEASSLGRVRSVDRNDSAGRPRRGKVLKQRTLPKGYKTVTLSVDGVYGPCLVHRLVLEAFVGGCPDGQQCRHLDSDPTNNRPENLAWGTQDENECDKLIRGTRAKGRRQGHAKLTEVAVREIRDPLSGSLAALARKYKVSTTTVWQVKHRRTWRHI